MLNLLKPFFGEGATASVYEPANLLIIQDNARSMRRTMDLIAMFDGEQFAGQRVRLFEIENSRPSDLAKDQVLLYEGPKKRLHHLAFAAPGEEYAAVRVVEYAESQLVERKAGYLIACHLFQVQGGRVGRDLPSSERATGSTAAASSPRRGSACASATLR